MYSKVTFYLLRIFCNFDWCFLIFSYRRCLTGVPRGVILSKESVVLFGGCVCVCHHPPVRAVCPNHEVAVFQPGTVNARVVVSVANITTILALPSHLFQPCSVSLFPPPHGLISYFSPIFHPLTPILSLFAPASPIPFLPGRGATVHLDSTPTCRLPPLVCTSLPSLMAPGLPQQSCD